MNLSVYLNSSLAGGTNSSNFSDSWEYKIIFKSRCNNASVAVFSNTLDLYVFTKRRGSWIPIYYYSCTKLFVFNRSPSDRLIIARRWRSKHTSEWDLMRCRDATAVRQFRPKWPAPLVRLGDLGASVEIIMHSLKGSIHSVREICHKYMYWASKGPHVKCTSYFVGNCN
jgi:hypothetical protein